jgi:hypothetical protein
MGDKHDLTERAGRSYWREADARVIVEAWQQSGETGAGFARRLGVHPKRLWWWASRLRKREPAAMRFHPVRVASAETSRREGWIEMDLGHGPRVRVAPGFAAEDLRRVLTVLEEVASC